MKIAPQPTNESGRLKALNRYQILDTNAEKKYDDLVFLASYICETPIALISLIDKYRQWFKAKIGLSATQTSRDYAFCAHTILSPNVMIVNDAFQDERFHDNPLVTKDPKIRFYAGAPLITSDGYRLGTICVIDIIPREISDRQTKALQALANVVVNCFEMRMYLEQLELANAQIANTNKRLGEANQVKSKFLAMAAHDLKNPLASVYGLGLLLLNEPQSDEEQQEILNGIVFSSKRMLELINELLETTALDLGKTELQKQVLDVGTILKIVVEANQSQYLAKQQQVIMDAAPGSMISVDYNRIYTVFDNLISNAVKFSYRDSKIWIKVRNLVESVLVEVKDEGQGMTSEDLKKVFGRFQRLSAKPTDGENSTGLGLSISKELVELHGGSIWAQSDGQEHGTTFYVELPKSEVKSTQKNGTNG